jgi:hypothetical protein
MVEETIMGVGHIFPHLRGHFLQAFEKIKGKVQRFIEQKMSQQSKVTSLEGGVSTFTCN